MLKDDCSVYYDSKRNRLIYIGRPADEGYWDQHWRASLRAKDIRKPNKFVVEVTKKYLPQGARVVDAGCGTARTVFGLQAAGFDAYGIDFAPETVETINRLAPELKVSVADVRDMSGFSDGYFDGVWSLGVVEHFFDGFDEIAAETHRIIRPGGYAFVTVPAMSPLRSVKAKLGLFPRWAGQSQADFYQYALSPEDVVAGFTKFGFSLRSSSGCAGFKGLKDEVSPLRPYLQKMYDNNSKIMKGFVFGADLALRGFSHHTKLYVFQRV